MRKCITWVQVPLALGSYDNNTVAAEHFTFSTMVLPPQCEGPLHVHDDVEEVFFMLRGSIELFVELDGEKFSTKLQERDLISIPPGVITAACSTLGKKRR